MKGYVSWHIVAKKLLHRNSVISSDSKPEVGRGHPVPLFDHRKVLSADSNGLCHFRLGFGEVRSCLYQPIPPAYFHNSITSLWSRFVSTSLYDTLGDKSTLFVTFCCPAFFLSRTVAIMASECSAGG